MRTYPFTICPAQIIVEFQQADKNDEGLALTVLHISKLTLDNFRNYRRLSLELPPSAVVLQGDNAQGKTNLLEAIWMLATTRSPRASNERELVHREALHDPLPAARLFAEVLRAAGALTAEVSLTIEPASRSSRSSAGLLRKRVRLNGVVRRAADVVGQVNVVMFSADDIALISGSPTERRRYLDLIGSRIDARYLRSLQRYQKVLWQRNHLLVMLQQRNARPEQLEFWDRELVQHGSYIIAQRQALLAELRSLAAPVHHELSGGIESIGLDYRPNVGEGLAEAEIGPAFEAALAASRNREIAQGITLTGPHRDDLAVAVNGVDMGTYGSRGQQRTCALSLRLGEARYLQAHFNGDHPIVLLDDVLSELDRSRRQHLSRFLAPFQQVLITVTDLDALDPSFLQGAVRLGVKEGSITPL